MWREIMKCGEAGTGNTHSGRSCNCKAVIFKVNMYQLLFFAMHLLGSIKIVCLQQIDDPPPSCRQVCYFDGKHKNVDCSSLDLGKVPTSDGCQRARMLDLSCNSITSLHSDGLLGYGNVEHLDLSNNAIASLEPRSFAGCFSVSYISLSSNQIAILQNEEFGECNNTLQQLHLDRNQLVIIEKGTFKNLTKLTHLFLSHNNLQSLNSTIFEDLHLLESLNLNSNELTSLPEGLFKSLCRLQNLDLSNNDLLVLGDELFSPHCHLVTFILANNRLRNIPNPSHCPCLNNLQTLDVRNNNISDASNITKYIKCTEKLFIDNNPFRCDCSLEDVRVWIIEEVTSRTSSELSCTEPSSGERRLISSLGDLCPTTIHPPGTSSSSLSPTSSHKESNQRIAMAASEGTVSLTHEEDNGFSGRNNVDVVKLPTVAAEALLIKDSAIHYYGLVVVIMVMGILVFIILLIIIILLAICLCQTNRNVEKMTKTIMDSKLTPRRMKNIINKAKNFSSPYPPTNEQKRQKSSQDTWDETPVKASRMPSESTPTLKINMSGVRKRTPQSSDKMILNNSPNKMSKPRNDQKDGESNSYFLDLDKNDEEKKPFIRKLGKQFEGMFQGSQDTYDLEVVGAQISSSEVKDAEKINFSQNDGFDKENALNQSFQEKKDLENGIQKGENDLKIPNTLQESGEEKVVALKESVSFTERVNNLQCGKGNFNQRRNLESSCRNQRKDIVSTREFPQKCEVSEESDRDKETVNNPDKENATHTKFSNFGSRSQLKDGKFKLDKTPQKSVEKKFAVLKESDQDNLNLSSSKC